MKRFNLMSWALALTVMCMMFTSCEKDATTSDEPGNNPFLGTWYSTEYDDVTVVFKATKWEVKEGSYAFFAGTYTYSGKTATLTVTDADDDDIIGEKCTAKISGKKLTITDPDGDTMEFTKDDGDEPEPGDNLFLGTWYSTEYYDVTADFTATKWAIKEDGYAFYSGTYTFNGKTATLTVTDADDDDIIGEKCTAKIVGDILTITDPDGDTMEFSKDDDPPPPPPGGAQVRFIKAEAYPEITIMAIDDEEDELVRHDFGESAGTSPYFDVPAGYLYPNIYYVPDGKWYYCFSDPYNFKAGHKYSIVCDTDDEDYFVFSVTDDGTFKSGKRTQIPVNSNIEKKVLKAITLKR